MNKTLIIVITVFVLTGIILLVVLLTKSRPSGKTCSGNGAYDSIGKKCICNANWSGTDCDTCKGNWGGTDCDTCKGNWGGTDCSTCKGNWSGADCDKCSVNWSGDKCDKLSISPMTTNTSPLGYTASSSGFYDYQGRDAWHAFSEIDDYFQSTLNNYNTTNGTYIGTNSTLITRDEQLPGDWLQIQLPGSINIISYTINTDANGGTTRSPSTFSFLYSNDGINWIIADTQTLYQWISPYKTVFILKSPITSKYFRISCSLIGNMGVNVNRNCFIIKQLTLNQP